MKNLLILTALLGIFQFVFGQDSKITGSVMDKKTGEPVIGASVVIEGTAKGAATDIFGVYTINNVEAGTYTLVISYLGYKKMKISDVVVREGRNTDLNIAMEEDTEMEIGEVVVVTSRISNTDASVLIDMKNADQIVSGVSAQAIAKTLDRDAAQVVRRIPGITISGNFIQIRGLSARYNNVMLHDVFAPSVETDVRAFSFDIIPSSQLERIMVYKSPAADVSGEFSGGLVKIYTRSIPDENSIVVNYTTGYRAGTTFQEFLFQERDGLYHTGFNSGLLSLPGEFPSDLRQVNSATALEEAGRSLRNVWEPRSQNAFLDQRAGITGNFKMKSKRAEIGNVTSINYSNTNATFDVERHDYNTFDKDANQSSVIYNYVDRQYNKSIRFGVIHNWAFRFSQKSKIEFKNLFNQSSMGQYVNRTGPNFESAVFLDNASYDQIYRGIYSGQFLGEHKLNADKTQLNWVVGYNNAYRDQPDYKRYRSTVDLVTGDRILYVPPGAAAAEFLGRFFSNMSEHTGTAAFNLSQKIALSDRFIPTLKAGIFAEYKNREFKARNIGYTRASSANFDTDLANLTIWELFEEENINNTTGIRIDEQSNPNDNYSASNRLLAYYLSTVLPITKKLNIIAGVRVEDNVQKLNSFDLTNRPIEVNNPIINVFPSVNISYNFTEQLLLRGAYGMTTNRPEFRELAPFGFYDFNFNFTNKGNPNLETPIIHNADLRFEYYPGKNELVSVAGFYKFFDKPIETLFLEGAGSGGAKNFTYGNAESSYSAGVEVEVKKSLRFFGDTKFFNDLSLGLNAAYIISKINLGEKSLGQSDNRPLQGQAPFIVNAGLFYANENSGLQVNLIYNVVGRRILFVGYEGYPDVYEMPRSVLDLSVSKTLGKRWTINAGIADIINQEILMLQDGNLDGVFDRANDQSIQRFRPGQYVTVGFSFKIL